jgi:Ser/Thr protein kinase RdoA (MazF antagonist)
MDRAHLLANNEDALLNHAAECYDLEVESLRSFDAYEGCENLVYACQRRNTPMILRISFRPDRSLAQIEAEIDFIQFLDQNGVRVSTPILSKSGDYIETFSIEGKQLHLVCFHKGRGIRVPDNGYRYRQDAPIEEYYRNWGAILGQMHACAKSYPPQNPPRCRPDWFELHAAKLDLDGVIPQALPLVKERIRFLLEEIRSLPRDTQGFGLIHGDFNDGNFTVDYTNGDITVFDFDDCCTFWFAYELAAAWEGGIGRVMFQDLPARKGFMQDYMDHVLTGYSCENDLPDEWLEKIPLFIKLIQAEEFLHYARYSDTADAEISAHLRYLIACIEQDLPYMGFFEPIYSPDKPFLL